MSSTGLQFEVVYPSAEQAETVRDEITQRGASADLSEAQGLLPLAVLLAVTVPPGAALLLTVIDRIIHGWIGHGLVIDARGTGPARIIGQVDLPYGTTVVLTRDGDQVKRDNLPQDKQSDYISKVLTAISAGASASAADKEGSK